MPIKIAKEGHERLRRDTDNDHQHIIQVTEEVYQSGDWGDGVYDERGIDPEELAGGLGPKGRARGRKNK